MATPKKPPGSWKGGRDYSGGRNMPYGTSYRGGYGGGGGGGGGGGKEGRIISQWGGLDSSSDWVEWIEWEVKGKWLAPNKDIQHAKGGVVFCLVR